METRAYLILDIREVWIWKMVLLRFVCHEDYSNKTL